jgi:hypothetical protein
MWVRAVTRRDLVDLITPRRTMTVPDAVEESRPSFDMVRADTMAAVWPSRPAESGLPTAIVVPEGSRRDALAWLSTYVRDFRPFTAYCRVVEKPVAEQFLRGPTVPNLQNAEGICSGLVLGEALTHAAGRTSIFDLPATVCWATLSHAISRTWALTGNSITPEVVARLWTEVRELTEQNGLSLPTSAILSVWNVVLQLPAYPRQARTLFDSSDVLVAAWYDLTTFGEIRDAGWQRLVEGYSDLDRMRLLIQMPREQRVQMVDVALRLLASRRTEADDRGPFLAGYLTSLLAPGSLDHTDILAPVISVLPTAYLWYGLCAGFNPKGDALPVGNTLARRIVRDLTLPDRLADRPRCDIALEELAIHGPGDHLLRLTAKAARLDVDILPGVTVSVRWPWRESPPEDQRNRAREVELRELLAEAESNTARWHVLTERLRRMLDTHDEASKSNAKRKKGGRL